MKAKVEEINPVQHRIRVTVPSENVDKAFDSAYRKIQKKAKIQGFRPGKAPLYIIKKVYGGNVSAEVGESLIQDNLFPAIQENNVKPIAPPFVETEAAPSAGNEYQFSAVIDVMPKIELGQAHKGLSISCKKYESSDQAIEKELKRLARMQAKTSTLEESDTVISMGHSVTLTHTATHNGQNLEQFDVKKVPVAIGHDELFKDLENALLGMKAGETKKVAITLPTEYGSADLAGKELDFTITIDEISKLDIPAIDDDLAKDMNFDNLDELKDRISKNIEKSISDSNRKELEHNLLTNLVGKINFEVPPAMVDQVIDGMIQEMQLPEEEKKKALKDNAIRKSMREEAKVKVRNTIALWEVIKTEDLKIDDDTIREHIKSFIDEKDPEKEKRIEQTFESMKDRLRENLLFESAIDFLKANAEINFETISV